MKWLASPLFINVISGFLIGSTVTLLIVFALQSRVEALRSQGTSQASPEDTLTSSGFDLFAYKELAPPRETLWRWLIYANNEPIRRDVEYQPHVPGQIIALDYVVDCRGFRLNNALRNDLLDATPRWLKIAIRSNDDLHWLTKLDSCNYPSELYGLSIESEEPDVVYDLSPLEQLKKLKWLHINVKQGSISCMPRLPRIQLISTQSTGSDDYNNERLFGGFGLMPQLREWHHVGGLSEEGYIACLRQCPNLEVLDLNSSKGITAKVVSSICKLTRLREIRLGFSDVSFEDKKRLKAALPNCVIDDSM